MMWIKYDADSKLKEGKDYLVMYENGRVAVFDWCEGWNCFRMSDGTTYKDAEIESVMWFCDPDEIEFQEVCDG